MRSVRIRRLLAPLLIKFRRDDLVVQFAASCRHNSQQSAKSGIKNKKGVYVGLGSCLISAVSAYTYLNHRDELKINNILGITKPDGPVFTRKQVAQHDSLESGVWITYKGKVYDITDFIAHHPGGSHTILMGAGGDVEPFWKTYTVHDAKEVQNLLAQYQIGVLESKDCELVQDTGGEASPYATDPERSPILKVLSKEPFNSETPSKLLSATNYTPNEIFFVRNHLPVPEVDLADYRLTICVGTDREPDKQKVIAVLTLDELKQNFMPHSIDCIIQCSGNRRSDLKKLKEIKGLDWGVGAIGNATWTGIRLTDLLRYLKINPSNEDVKHVQMEGLDCDMSGQSYNASISADVALDPAHDVILAYEMNGQPLSRDHGFPLRFVAPGITGARNVKWLSKIILSHEESTGHWQRRDYKSFSPNVDMFNLNYDESISIQEMPVQSAICDPNDGDNIVLQQTSDGESSFPVKGYAYSGGGKMIVRVDVSTDSGKTWHTAKLKNVAVDENGLPDYSKRNQSWSWTQWELDVPVDEKALESSGGTFEICCRAFDSAYNSQPERAETIWNVRGVVNNSWHKIKLNIKPLATS